MSTSTTAAPPRTVEFDEALSMIRAIEGREVRATATEAMTEVEVVGLYGALDCSEEHWEHAGHLFGVIEEDGSPSGWVDLRPDAVDYCVTEEGYVNVKGDRLTWRIELVA